MLTSCRCTAASSISGYIVEEDLDGDGEPDLFLAAPRARASAGDMLDLALMAGGYIVYIPAADTEKKAHRGRQLHLPGGSTTAGFRARPASDPTPNTLDVRRTAVNDAPGWPISRPQITVANDTTVLIDGAVTFADVEGNLDGGTLDRERAAGRRYRGVPRPGPGAGRDRRERHQRDLRKRDHRHLSGGAGGTFMVTLNAAATPAAIDDALIENLSFGNAGDTPVAGRDLTLTVTDDSGDAVSRTITVNVEAVNDAPRRACRPTRRSAATSTSRSRWPGSRSPMPTRLPAPRSRSR